MDSGYRKGRSLGKTPSRNGMWLKKVMRHEPLVSATVTKQFGTRHEEHAPPLCDNPSLGTTHERLEHAVDLDSILIKIP